MFGLTKYVDKLYDIKWFINEDELQDIEQLLYCKFTKERSKKYYKIGQIQYTYIDILLGMEELEFVFEKKDGDYILTIK